MSAMKTGILMVVIFGLLILIGYPFGPTGLTVAFLFALALNGFAYWFSDKVILAMYRAKEVSSEEAPKLYAVVRSLVARTYLPMPRVYVIENETPNAFATGRNPKHAAVAVTTGLLRLLSEEELSGVIGHELAHVENRDILLATVAATIAGTISFIGTMIRWTAIFGGGGDRRDGERGNPIALLVLAILVPLVAYFIQLWISRTREYAADARGADIAGNPFRLADALQRLERGVARAPMDAGPATAHLFIVSPFSAKRAFSWFSTHPPIEDRVARLEKIAEAEGIRRT